MGHFCQPHDLMLSRLMSSSPRIFFLVVVVVVVLV